MRKNILYIALGILVLVLFAIIAQEVTRDKNFRWTPSYLSYDKQPLGGVLVYQRLEDLFPGNEVSMLDRDLFLQYDSIVFAWQDHYYKHSYGDNSSYDEEATELDESIEYYDSTTEEEVLTEEEGTALLDTIVGEVLKEFQVTITKSDSDSYEIPYLANFDTSNIFLVKSDLYLTDFDTKALLTHIYQGNAAFIACDSYYPIAKELGFKLKRVDWSVDSLKKTNLVYGDLKNKITIPDTNYHFIKPYYYRFDSIKGDAKILMYNELQQPLMIAINYGKGVFYLCTVPNLFTNYYILKPHREMIERAITNLPNKHTYWGNNYFNRIDPNREKLGLLQFIMSEPALKWAFYTLFFTVILLMLLELRRKQAPIPVIEPPKNSTLEFVTTISQLYLSGNNHKVIADKKINFFLEHLRTSYKIKTNKFDDEFYFILSEKSGYSEEKLRKVFYLIRRLLHSDEVTKEQLQKLAGFIYKFKNGKL